GPGTGLDHAPRRHLRGRWQRRLDRGSGDRLMALARRCLPVIIAGVLVGSCANPPPGPTEPSTQAPEGASPILATPSAAIATTPPATVDHAAGSPRIVLRSASPSGTATWSVT